MKKKINKSFIIVAMIAILLTAVGAMFLYLHSLQEQIYDDLRANAHVVAAVSSEKLVDTIDENLVKDGLRITIVDKDGTVTYDSMEVAAEMENHFDRPEIQGALENGAATSVRFSETSSKQTYYYAMLLEDGTVLRVGKETGSVYQYLYRLIGMIVIVALLVFGMCLPFSHFLTKKLVEPIEEIATNITRVDEESVYEEVRPFITTIKQQHIDILENAQMRQEFTANVSHELKTPLTAISGYAELIESGMTNEEDTAHFASEIHRSAERLQALINDIIKLSELDSDDHRMETEPLELAEMVTDCIHNLAISAEKQEVTLLQSGSPVVITGNRTLIEEVLYNLCSNAIRYNKKGGNVTIYTGMKDGHAVLSVKDTGIGIPKEHQARIFERFYRVDKSRSKSTGGTGLGLAIVKHIIAQHNAQIQLTSEEGIGTEIKVIF
ncbi:MAG: ATP-binding protein [Roseburia sp.]